MKERKLREGREARVEIQKRAKLSSPHLVRLAERLRKPVEELLQGIPEDTLRRLKFPVRESVEKDGKRSFEPPVQVTDGIRSTIAGDQGKTHRV